MAQFPLVFLSLLLLIKASFSRHQPREPSRSVPSSFSARMAALQLCNEDQRRVILEGINSLDWILERTTDEIARPLNNEGIGQSFTYHFGRRLNQYRRRVWERLWAIRQELIAHHGSLPIFCFDVEGRCTEQPDRALYIDVNRAFVVVVRSLKLKHCIEGCQCLRTLIGCTVPRMVRSCAMGFRLRHNRSDWDALIRNATDASNLSPRGRSTSIRARS